MVKLNHGDVVKLLGQHDSWFNVETTDGSQGWIEQSLLTLVPGAAALVADASSVPTIAPQPTATKASLPAAAHVADAPTAVATITPTVRPKPAPTAEPAAQVVRAARVASWIWPTSGDITSPFGYRDFEVSGSSFHNGIDISNSRWTPIVAARSGTVLEAGWCSGYGYCVIMDNGGGYTTEYGHMASNPVVYAGQEVRAGQPIGYMGNTYDAAGGGYSTGVHLHFTIKINGRAVDPLRFLP
ncbi:MAG: peptidoglycan DD-metalloendopeptidase family protein [Herpetosiphonaceae bacterium]|nr:peptidoglycan DD-metalloendopeptidase family protein [Herpetosiphonaceae bacterium]